MAEEVEVLVFKERIAALEQRVADMIAEEDDREDAVRAAVAADRKHTLALMRHLAPAAAEHALPAGPNWIESLAKMLPDLVPILRSLIDTAGDRLTRNPPDDDGEPLVEGVPEGAESFVIVAEGRIRGIVDVDVTADGVASRFGTGTFDLLACGRSGVLLSVAAIRVSVKAVS